MFILKSTHERIVSKKDDHITQLAGEITKKTNRIEKLESECAYLAKLKQQFERISEQSDYQIVAEAIETMEDNERLKAEINKLREKYAPYEAQESLMNARYQNSNPQSLSEMIIGSSKY